MQSARHDLQHLAATVLKGAPPEEAPVLAWPLACGSAVAARTEATEFQNGTLTVRVPDRGWRSELQSFSAQYIQKLSALCGVSIHRIVYQIDESHPTRS